MDVWWVQQTVRVTRGHTPTDLNFDMVFGERATQDDVYSHVKGM